MTRFRTALLALLAGAVAAGLLASAGPAEAQKRGGTLTIVRPTDPVSLDPNLETTAPGAWVYFNMLEGLLTLDAKMQVQPLAGHLLRGDVAHAGALQAPARGEVPRRHPDERRRGEVHL